MNFKNALILQPLVLTIFFILLRYNDNLDELVIADLFYVLIIFIPIVVGFTFIIKIIIKNNLKSILVSSFFTLLFFIYVPLHDVLYGFQIGSFSIGSHTILFPILFIVSAFLIYKILKSKKNFEKILSISFVTISVLVIFNVSEIVFYSDAYSSNLDEELIQEFLIEKENFRDVYYILLDEHSGTDALQKYLNYDNSNFNKSLEDLGFFIPEKSFSNYTPTRLSIPSIVNMDYISINPELNQKEYVITLEKKVSDNLVAKIFEKNDYDIISFHNELNMKIETKQGIELCRNDIGSHQFLSFILDNSAVLLLKNYIDAGNFKQLAENRLCVFNEIMSLEEETSNPVFVYAHILLPHFPFLFDSDGTIKPYEKNLPDDLTQEYISQLQYTDSMILEIVEKLVNNEYPPIIIIQSDHGLRTNPNIDDYDSLEQSFSNFSAFYFPNVEFTNKNQVITAVNTFRILFNENFGTNYELLENKIFLSIEDRKFKDIANILISQHKLD